ncbi:MAG: hypothetical protein GY910_10270 [bacterium]|nr:hypothetical protein [bacterium]
MSEPALLQLSSEIDSEIEDAFNRWCDAHLRVDLALPGYRRARRLLRDQNWAGSGAAMPYLTLYDLEDLSALTSEAHRRHDQSMPEAFEGHLRFERAVFREIACLGVDAAEVEGAALFHVMIEVEAGFEEEFERWYAGEHVPAVLTTPGVLSVRRYLQVEDPAGRTSPPERYTCLAIYEMDDAEVLARPEAIRIAEAASCPPDLESHWRVTHHVFEPFFCARKE